MRWNSFVLGSVTAGLIALIMVSVPQPVLAETTLFRDSVRLVQAEGSARIYAVVDGKRHLIRNPLILQSYAYRDKQVAPVSTATLATYAATRLVMSSAGPRVYLLAPRDQKVWFPTEDSFLKSGERWSEIVHISQYDSRSYRNAVLVKTSDDPKVYYLDYTQATRAPFASEQDFLQSGFVWGDIVTVPQALLDGYRLVAPVKPGERAPEQVISTATLSVASGDAQKRTFPSGTVRNKAWDVVLTSSRGPVSIRSLAITRFGFAGNEVSDVMLFDERGVALSRPIHFNDRRAEFQFLSPLVVPLNASRRLTVAVSISSSFQGTLGTLRLGVDKAADVVADASVVGTFPVQGAEHTIVAATGVVGQVTIDSQEIAGSVREVIVGTSDQLLAKLELHAPSSAEDVRLRRLLFTTTGGNTTDFSGYEIIDDRGRKITATFAQPTTTQLSVTFGSGYTIPRGERRVLQLRGDVVGGEYRTVQFLLMDALGVEAEGATQGYALTVVAGPLEGSFPIGDRGGAGFNAVKILPGQASATLSATTPKGALIRGAVDTILASYDVKSLGTTLSFEQVSIRASGAGPSTRFEGTVKLRLKGGAVLASVDGAAVLTSDQRFQLSPPPQLLSGKTYTFEVVGSIADSATALDSYAVSLSQFRLTPTGGGSPLTLSASVDGPSRPVQELGLSVRHDVNVKSGVAVAGRRGVKIGRFLFRAGSGENIILDSVTVTSEGATALTFSQGYSNVKLGSKIIATPTGSPYQFSLGTTIGATREVGYDLYVDTSTAVAGDVVQLRVTSVVARGATSGARVEVSLVEPLSAMTTFLETKVRAGVDTAFGGGTTTRSATTVLGSFTITAEGAEDVATSSLVLRQVAGGDVSSSRGYINLKLLDASTKRGVSATVSKPLGGTVGDTLATGPTVKAGTTMTVWLVVDARNAPAGESAQFVLSGIQAKGKSSGLSATVSGTPVTGSLVQY